MVCGIDGVVRSDLLQHPLGFVDCVPITAPRRCHGRFPRSRQSGAITEHLRFGYGITVEAIAAMHAARTLACGVEPA